jgi:hypothetical protein
MTKCQECGATYPNNADHICVESIPTITDERLKKEIETEMGEYVSTETIPTPAVKMKSFRAVVKRVLVEEGYVDGHAISEEVFRRKIVKNSADTQWLINENEEHVTIGSIVVVDCVDKKDGEC